MSAELISLQGNVVKKKEFNLNTGVNRLSIDNTDVLLAGIYILRAEFNGKIIQRKVVRLNSN
jgi:hypothetical protein